MPLPDRKKFDAGLPPVAAVPPAPEPEPESTPEPEAAKKPRGARPKQTVPAGPDPHYIRRERRKPNAVLVQFGTRINPDLRSAMKKFCDENDEAITDFIERSIEYMLHNSKERP